MRILIRFFKRAMFFLVMFFCSTTVFCGQNSQAEGLNETLIETTPRPSVYHRAILSRKPNGKESWLVIAFPGYPGIMRIAQNEGAIEYELKGNFLVRARRHLVSEQIAVATLDCPSDQFSDCGDSYRASETHLQDVRLQIAAIKKQFPSDIKIALLGTSYGTVSTELLAKRMQGEVDAAIHSASITAPSSRNGSPLIGIDLMQIKLKQLLVHHVNDPCSLTPYSGLKRYENLLPIIQVVGVENPRGPICEAFTAHGFVGRERAVMNAIRAWLLTEKIISPIE